MPSLASFLREDSEYINAAKDTSRDVSIIKKYLADESFRTENNEHHLALSEAIVGNDLEIVSLILAKANEHDNPINPFEVPNQKFKHTLSTLVDNALRYARTAVIMLLLKQQPVQEYLRTVSRKTYTFNFLRDMFDAESKLRCATKILELAIAGQPERMPVKVPALDVCNQILHAKEQLFFSYKVFAKRLNNGLKQGADGSLPALPTEVVNKIYQYALADEDLMDLSSLKEANLHRNRSKLALKN